MLYDSTLIFNHYQSLASKVLQRWWLPKKESALACSILVMYIFPLAQP